MTAEKYLSRYRWLNAEIKSKRDMLAELRERAQSASAASCENNIPSKNPYDKIGEITAKIVDLEREINQRIESLLCVQREILTAISEVSDERLQTLLSLRYLNCLTFEEIAERMSYSRVQIYRLHKKALDCVKMIWNDT